MNILVLAVYRGQYRGQANTGVKANTGVRSLIYDDVSAKIIF